MTYRMKQCLLELLAELPKTIRFVVWIPEEYAHEGKVVRLRKNEAPAVYKIVEVYDVALSVEYVAEHERDYRSQRDASDI